MGSRGDEVTSRSCRGLGILFLGDGAPELLSRPYNFCKLVTRDSGNVSEQEIRHDACRDGDADDCYSQSRWVPLASWKAVSKTKTSRRTCCITYQYLRGQRTPTDVDTPVKCMAATPVLATTAKSSCWVK